MLHCVRNCFPDLIWLRGCSRLQRMARSQPQLTTARQNDFRSASPPQLAYARGFSQPCYDFFSCNVFFILHTKPSPSSLTSALSEKSLDIGGESALVCERLIPRPAMAQHHFRAHNDLLCVCACVRVCKEAILKREQQRSHLTTVHIKGRFGHRATETFLEDELLPLSYLKLFIYINYSFPTRITVILIACKFEKRCFTS